MKPSYPLHPSLSLFLSSTLLSSPFPRQGSSVLLLLFLFLLLLLLLRPLTATSSLRSSLLSLSLSPPFVRSPSFLFSSCSLCLFFHALRCRSLGRTAAAEQRTGARRDAFSRGMRCADKGPALLALTNKDTRQPSRE